MASWNKEKKKWKARIRINGKEFFLGYHDSYHVATTLERSVRKVNPAKNRGLNNNPTGRNQAVRGFPWNDGK